MLCLSFPGSFWRKVREHYHGDVNVDDFDAVMGVMELLNEDNVIMFILEL